MITCPAHLLEKVGFAGLQYAGMWFAGLRFGASVQALQVAGFASCGACGLRGLRFAGWLFSCFRFTSFAGSGIRGLRVVGFSSCGFAGYEFAVCG